MTFSFVSPSSPCSNSIKFVYEAVCLDCGSLVKEDNGFLMEQRTACKHCGSKERKYPQLAKSYNSGLSGVLKAKTNDHHNGRPSTNETAGASFFKREDRWVWRNVEIDRKRDNYEEIVLDPESGEIIHYCKEPLSEHRSHVSAKPEQRPND